MAQHKNIKPQSIVPTHHCKLNVTGDAEVGKTAMLISYTTNKFPHGYIPRVFDSYTKKMEFGGCQVEVGFWDSAGHEDYDRLRPLSYPGADVFLICFSIIDKKSFHRIKSHWLPEIHHHIPGVPFLIIGCKSELRDNQTCKNQQDAFKLIYGYLRSCTSDLLLRDLDIIIEGYLQDGYHNECVTDKEAEKLCKELGGYKYVSCSSIEMKGLSQVFDSVMECVVERKTQRRPKRVGCNVL